MSFMENLTEAILMSTYIMLMRTEENYLYIIMKL